MREPAQVGMTPLVVLVERLTLALERSSFMSWRRCPPKIKVPPTLIREMKDSSTVPRFFPP